MVIQKENLLIISPTLPNPKMSAGDYRVYTLVKELKKYFNLFFIPLNHKNVNKQDIKNFSQITCIIKPINSIKIFQNFLKEKNISICIFEKYFNMPFEIYKFMSSVKIPIIDTHEIGFLKSQALSKIQKTDNLKLFKAKELLFYKNAKILIAITGKEKTILQQYFPDKKIVIIPTCTKISKTERPFSKRKDICYFGFYGHQPNIDAVNYFTKNIFNKINIPNIKFYILGYGSNKIKNIPNNIIRIDNITNISKELSKYKVFICPLRYGAGLKKKILDAMASHTPVVSTSFRIEGIKNIDTKYFDINSNDFINKIIELYTDKNLWQKESKYNFNIVKKYYSLTAFKTYIKDFVKIIKKQKF